MKTTLQAVAVQVQLDKCITICSIYLLPNNDFTLNPADFQDLVNQLSVPFMVLGDFNAHSPRWGGNRLDDRGEKIEDFVNQN